MLLWDFFTRVMHGVTTAFLEDVWSRNFLNLFATPLSIAEYLAGLVLSSIATSSIGLIVMLVLATVVFGLSFFAYGLALIPFLLVLFLFGIALGIFAIAHRSCGYGPAAEWFVWPIPAVLSPFAAVFYPLSTLPAMDAVRLAPAAAVLRLRVACGRSSPAAPPHWPGLFGSIVARDPVHPARRLVLHPHLPPRRPHRPHRPLQRRNPVVVGVVSSRNPHPFGRPGRNPRPHQDRPLGM